MGLCGQGHHIVAPYLGRSHRLPSLCRCELGGRAPAREIDAVARRQFILAGLVEEDTPTRISSGFPDMADQPYGVGINLDNTGLVRQRHARTHPQ